MSVIVVSFNTRDLLRRCLASLGQGHEVIVVDNASTDGSADMTRAEFPAVRLIENEENLGFGSANNQGLDAMTGDVALLLNSDAYATEGAVERLLEVMGDASVVACGGLLFDPAKLDIALGWSRHLHGSYVERGRMTGRDAQVLASRQLTRSVQQSCANALTLWAVLCEQTGLEKLFPSSRLLSPYWETRRILAKVVTPSPTLPHSGTIIPHGGGSPESHHPSPVTRHAYDVAQVMGACLMMRPVERFDERFFLYCEDTELCRRLRRHGRIVYVPDAVFGHELGASSAGTRWESVARYNRGKELYFAIHHGALQSGLCWLLDRLGALLRLSVSVLATLLTLGLAASPRTKAGVFFHALLAPVAGPADPRRHAAGSPPSAPPR